MQQSPVFKKICFALAIYAFWLTTQNLLITENATHVIEDKMHNLLEPINTYLHDNPHISVYNLVLSSALIDLNMAIFIFKYLTTTYSDRAFVLLCCGFLFRQLCQFMNQLPPPTDFIWFDPGIPSALVTYHVAHDFFFSGHTLISLVLGTDLSNSSNKWVRLYGVLFIVYEITVILVTYSHYFMDVYGAIATYYMLSYFYDKWHAKFH